MIDTSYIYPGTRGIEAQINVYPIISPDGVARVIIDGSKGRFTDTFFSEDNALDWAADVLVAYYDWSNSEAEHMIQKVWQARQATESI